MDKLESECWIFSTETPNLRESEITDNEFKIL
jgi:hypothetical protein